MTLNGGTVSAINQAATLNNSSITVGNGDTATLGGTQNITVTPGIATGNSGSALDVTNAGITTLSSALTGAGALNQSAGTLVASGNSSAYTGAVDLSGGTLEANNASNAFGTGALALNGGTVSAINQATTLSNSSVTVGNGDTATLGGTQNITVTPGIATGNSSSALDITNTRYDDTQQCTNRSRCIKSKCRYSSRIG